MSMDDRRSSSDALVDCLADALTDEALEAEAAAAGEDIAGTAAVLRAHFLERVAAARSAAGRAQEPPREGAQTAKRPAGDDADAPPVIGRYPILRRLGAGGMGVVYAAYDEVLDRKVAIKVLRPSVADVDGRRRERLLREAQAMARVTHPNVVTVHDVGTAGAQVFVAMEFVAGVTVQEWLDAEKRSWREIAAVFRQAADGLAALHDAGLVHRDVKPSNMILGEDGRLRVLDLGLVGTEPREINETLPSGVSSSVNRLDVPLTITGERVGTPAYMSREQFLGVELTPSSDIFSLSIALYEALYDVHPFMAESYGKLQANILYGRVREPADLSMAPSWLYALVLSGLAVDPRKRPPSMHAFSAALAADPQRTHRRWIGTLGIAALATLGGGAISWTQLAPSEVACDGGDATMQALWDPSRAAAIKAAIVASGRPYAGALADRVNETLAGYVASWAAARRRACREYARGDHSDALYDARIACLDRRRQALEETLTILTETGAEVVDNAGQLVAKLPPLATCDDLTTLGQRRPTDPKIAGAVAALEGRLVRADALAHAGQAAQAIAAARAVTAEAQRLEHPPTVAAALLAEARASLNRPLPRRELADVLGRALSLALAEGLDALAAEAMIRRLYVRALLPGRSEGALEDLPLAAAMLERAGDPPELRALLLNNSGAIRLSAGDREGAREAFAAALAANERLFGADHLENAASLANLGMLTTDDREREALHARMIAIYEAHLGPEHPQTLDSRLLAALYTADPAAAAAALDDLCATFRAHGDRELARDCAFELGRLEDLRGATLSAREAFAAASAATPATSARRALVDAYLVVNAAERDPEALAAATAALRAVAAAVDAEHANEAIDWWIRLEQANRHLVLARLLLAADDAPATEATALLERALTDIDAITLEAPPIERERLLAACREVLAVALRRDPQHKRTGEVEARAASLNAAARAYFERWPDAYRRRLTRAPSPRRSP
ncbi:MAG: serine/threonine-protein kinase [Nannocystaceae bacterium]